MGSVDNEPVAWIAYDEFGDFMLEATPEGDYPWQPLYTHPAKTLTDEDIAKVVYELNQKANTTERWVTAMQIGAETIIQLRDELRKAQGD